MIWSYVLYVLTRGQAPLDPPNQGIQSYVLNVLLRSEPSTFSHSTLELFYVQSQSTFSLSTFSLLRSVVYIQSFYVASRHQFLDLLICRPFWHLYSVWRHMFYSFAQDAHTSCLDDLIKGLNPFIDIIVAFKWTQLLQKQSLTNVQLNLFYFDKNLNLGPLGHQTTAPET